MKLSLRRAKRGTSTPQPQPSAEPATPRILDENGQVIHPCPSCGGQVGEMTTCHTFGWKDDGTGGKACFGCSSAWEFWCGTPDIDDDIPYDSEGCGWSYIWGMNPRNPRSARNEENRPPWIPEGARCPL